MSCRVKIKFDMGNIHVVNTTNEFFSNWERIFCVFLVSVFLSVHTQNEVCTSKHIWILPL